MPNSTFLSNAIIDYTTGRASMPTDLARIIRLWQTMPAIDGTGGVEMSSLGYMPYTVVSASDFGLSSNGQVSNVRPITFGTSTGGGPFLEGITIQDSGSNFLRVLPFPDRQFWDADDGFTIPAGGILMVET